MWHEIMTASDVKNPCTLDQYAYIYVANMHAGRCHLHVLSCATWLNLNFPRQGAEYKPASSYPTRHAVMSHRMRFNTRLIKSKAKDTSPSKALLFGADGLTRVIIKR